MKLITILVLIIFLSGCVGIAVVGTTKDTYGPNVTLHEYRLLIRTSSPQQVSKEDVLKKWGEPDQKRKDGESEIWTYKNIPEQVSWTGIVLGLIIPLPLVVSTGYHKTSMIFTGDLLTDSDRTKKEAGGFMCALITPDGFRPACGAGW
jgi:hypothetical protein